MLVFKTCFCTIWVGNKVNGDSVRIRVNETCIQSSHVRITLMCSVLLLPCKVTFAWFQKVPQSALWAVDIFWYYLRLFSYKVELYFLKRYMLCCTSCCETAHQSPLPSMLLSGRTWIIRSDITWSSFPLSKFGVSKRKRQFITNSLSIDSTYTHS